MSRGKNTTPMRRTFKKNGRDLVQIPAIWQVGQFSVTKDKPKDILHGEVAICVSIDSQGKDVFSVTCEFWRKNKLGKKERPGVSTGPFTAHSLVEIVQQLTKESRILTLVNQLWDPDTMWDPTNSPFDPGLLYRIKQLKAKSGNTTLDPRRFRIGTLLSELVRQLEPVAEGLKLDEEAKRRAT